MFYWGFVPNRSQEPKLRFSKKHISIKQFAFISAMLMLPLVGLAQQIRIMPLGDSITHGEHGSYPIGGFRDDLADLLLNAGINFNLVGTLNDGTSSAYPWHEGHPGKTAEYLAANIVTWLNSTQPDIVLLHIGTNDINSRYSNTDIRDDIERICDTIWSFDATIPVLLCSIIPRNDSFNSTNTDLCRLVQQLAVKKLAEGKLIRYVGQNEVWVTDPTWRTSLLYDAFHPENAGYHVMAETYFNILMNQITSTSQFITDNFDRNQLSVTWNFDPPYAINLKKLTIQAGGNYWWKPAVYVAEMDPISVAFDWGSNVNPGLNGNAGIALHLQSYATTASGYLVYKESATQRLKLYLLNNGAVGQLLHEIPGKLGTPVQGDNFRVSMYQDFQGYHFTCFVNGNYDGDLIDPNNTYSSGNNHFAGIMLAGTANQIVDNFELTHSKRAAEKIHVAWGNEQAGQAQTRLADSLVVMVTDRYGNPISGVPVAYEVIQGDAVIRPPASGNHFEFEAEHGVITYPMQIMTDGSASGGKYVEVPAQYSDDYLGKVVFNFTVASEGDFVVWGRVQSGDYLHDSFKVIMDEQPEIVWHISGKYSWTWDQVFVLNGDDPVIFHLTAGTHILRIMNREWGSKLDKIVITNNLGFTPSSLSKPESFFYISNSSGRAHAIVDLGTTPGAIQIKASSPRFSDSKFFTATILTDKIPSVISIVDGNNQSASPNTLLPKPLTVEVKDAENKVIPNIGVKFEITQGAGGTLGNTNPVLTNSSGRAATTLTLGPGYGTYLVKASCPGYSVAPVTFQATATSAILSISGTAKYYQNTLPIPNAIFTTSGTGVVTATSDQQGIYELKNLEVNGNYTATPQKATFTNWQSHLITTYQAALTLRNAVGLHSFTSSQTKAADVDKNGTVTAYDAALIAQFAVGLPRLADSRVGDWIFIPAYRSYYSLNASYQAQDYTGILLGDVAGNWNPSYGLHKEFATPSIAGFHAATISADEISLPILIDPSIEVLAWQIVITYNPAQLRYLGTKKGASGSSYQFIEHDQNGELSAGMYGGEATNSDEPFAYLEFKILDPSIEQAELEIGYFQVNNDPAQPTKIALDVNPATPKAFALFQNYPNPFNPATTIVYQIPQIGQVTLAIFNMAGQQIITLDQGEKKPGSYRIEWNGKDAAGSEVTSGVYFCHLYYRNEVKMIKLVKVK